MKTFNLDSGAEGRYSIDVVNKASENGEYEAWMTTSGGAFENQAIEINKPVFSANWGFGGIVRSIYHEFVHVFQKSILGLYSDNNDQLKYMREYWAYQATINPNHLPAASNDMMTSWKNSVDKYYNKMNDMYKLQTKLPFLIIRP